MKAICVILTSFIVFLYKANLSGMIGDVPKGTYIVSAHIINNKGGITKLITADSIFIFKQWAAEVRMRTDLLEVNGIEQMPKHVRTGFYLINLKNRSFAESENLKNLQALKYKPLSEKKIGFDFSGEREFFHNEPYQVKECLYKGKKARKISYHIKGGSYNERQITIYVTDVPDPAQPLVLYAQMEKHFKGSVMEINIDLKEQGILVIQCPFSQKIKREYLEQLRALSEIAG